MLPGTGAAGITLFGLVALAIPISALPTNGRAETQTEIQELTASIPGITFGDALALAGDTAAITADGGEADDGRNVGLVYIFNRRHTGRWSEQQLIVHMDMGDGDGFGGSIALDRHALIVGAPADQENGINSGAAYVYASGPDGIWLEKQKLTASDSAGGFFGESVAIYGNTAMICAPTSGRVYVFTRNEDGDWIERQILTVSDGLFASSVDIDRDTALVGALHDSDYGTSSGAAYIFARGADGVWVEQQKLVASDAREQDRFGHSVALDDDYAVIGATSIETGDPRSRSGSAYVFVRRYDGAWIERQILSASDSEAGDLFGNSVDVDGDLILVGAMNNSYLGTRSGSAYVFTRGNGGVWKEQQRLIRSDGAEYDQFGRLVVVDSGVAMVSEYPNEYTGRNATVYVFALERKIDIDIKPYNSQNRINPGSWGTIWVAILSDNEFDPLQVKIWSARFGPDRARAVGYRVRDVNRDGIADLILKFKIRKTGIECGDTRTQIEAKTYFGNRVVGWDSIKTVGCKKKHCN
jgi:hypothetical protein